MRTASGALTALINAGQQEWVRADLFTFTDAAGSVLGRYTGADSDLTVGGHTFSAAGPVIKRGRVKTVVGVQVDEMDISLAASSAMLLNGVPWLSALRAGLLDGGRVLLERFLSDAWSNTAVGAVTWFGGLVSSIQIGRMSATIKVKSDLALLNTQMPREIFQPSCLNTLYDSKCGLTRATYTSASLSVNSGSTALTLAAALASTDGDYDRGYVAFTSGANAGVARTIKSSTCSTGVTTFVLARPLPFTPAIADAFTATKGCDRTQATCTSKFSNLVNFRGFPYVPKPETAA